MVSILIPDASQRDRIRNRLFESGVETRPLFYPIHLMPMYSQEQDRHPRSEDIAARGINLPSYPAIADSEVEYICEKLLAIA